MSAAVFGLTGEVGPEGFGATTLEGYLVLFTHPEFYAVAGLPPGLQAVEATSRQAAEYALAVGLRGFVLNPGTHQRFVEGDAPSRLRSPLRAPAPPEAPSLRPADTLSESLAATIAEAAEGSAVARAWIAEGPVVVTDPHPDPAFEAGLLARDVRLPSYGAAPEWPPVFERVAPAVARIRLAPLPQALEEGLARDLAAAARHAGLRELWAFEATVEGEEPVLAFAYAPHPNDFFAGEFDALHARHGLGPTSPLLDAETLREVLPQLGQRLA